MSSCLFIACEYELPTLYSPKLHKPDGREINVFQSEDDLYDLEIIPGMVFYDIPYYTKLSNIYDLNFRYPEERCQRLYDYLINNCKRYKKCEWSHSHPHLGCRFSEKSRYSPTSYPRRYHRPFCSHRPTGETEAHQRKSTEGQT